MKRSWFSILSVLILFGLLGLLATLQYHWVGQIGDAERDRLQKRLQNDTERFADDFNNEIRKVYFNFQMDADAWRKKDWAEFNERLEYWKNNSAYSALTSDFYFIGLDGERLAYDKNSKTFVAADLPGDISFLAGVAGQDRVEPIMEKIPALVMPVYENPERSAATPVRITIDQPRPKYGIFIVRLDKQVIEQEIFPSLAREYFSDDDGANYRLSVVGKNDSSEVIFKNHPDEPSTASDSSAQLFNLSPDKMAFFIDRDVVNAMKRTHDGIKEHASNFVFSQKFETRSETPINSPDKLPPNSTGNTGAEKSRTYNMKITQDSKPRVAMMESRNLNEEGAWILNVQHRDGSLDQFIANTRNRNLAVSFGILALLGVSVAMIFISAQRAKTFAQRQMDFVSSVSHEFRTPLAVLYSAGENLTDGVVDSREQVAEYGSLIKHEGKKLSRMVEQILEFAGARSGKRKYDLRPTNIAGILSDALAECRPLIDESGFTIEKNIQPDLPHVAADGTALNHAFQNLINNAIKYSRDSKHLKITAENGGGTIKLSFEDQGRGIHAREQAQIFEPFYRGKEVVEAQIHGNGLGLSLVKQIVEAHNGRVEVASRPGEGSKFTIKLPL